MLTLYIADVERDAGMKKLSREEAAKVLEGMKVKTEIPKAAVTQWERNAALDMAIEVLNCSEIPNKSDTISRQAAIELCDWYDNPSLHDDLEKLPPVQPDHNADISKKVSISCGQENDLISRREALNAITDELMQSTPLSAVIRAKNRLKDLSAVQPERIRCKDCKYWRDDHTCHEHSLVSPMCANEYCSRAERRTDE